MSTTVKFAKTYNHEEARPGKRRRTREYPAGYEGQVSDDVAKAAQDGGFLASADAAAGAEARAGTSAAGSTTEAKGVKG